MSGLSDEVKEKMRNIASICESKGLRWPKTEEWSSGEAGRKKKAQEIFSILQARAFDVELTVHALVDKFGQEKWALDGARDAANKEKSAEQDDSKKGVESPLEDSDAEEEAPAEDTKPKKKRKPSAKKEKPAAGEKSEGGDGDGEGDEAASGGTPTKAKKAKKASSSGTSPKKTETYVCEENRGFGDGLLEMAGLYYKAGEGMKGGVYSKAAKIVREHDAPITSGKEGMKLKGIGKGIGGFIDEFLQNGFVEKLEKMRAGDL